METASIVASFVSLILGGVAIWLSLYFYTQAKNTELRVQVALEGIKTQTDALQALNAKHLDRLTKYVTTPREESSQAAQLFAATIRDIPDIVLRLLPPPQTGNQASRSEIVHAYLALWNYTATANVWASFCLPLPQDFDEDAHRFIRYVVDRSAADFHYMTSLVEQLRPDEIRACAPSYVQFYEEVQNTLREMVGDTAHHFAQRARQQQ
jgi:hypothetical protein